MTKRKLAERQGDGVPAWLATARSRPVLLLAVVLLGVVSLSPVRAQDTGITDTTIRIGGVMDLEGDARGLGRGIKAGIEAAIEGECIQGRRIEFMAVNDFYDPPTTIEATQGLVDQGVFAMLGNVGAPNAQVALPILAEHKVPAVGFFTGAGILRSGVGDVVNFRASSAQETATVIEAALDAGLHPGEICAYVQNDAFGMAGPAGIKLALAGREDAEGIVEILDRIMAMEGEEPARNGLGPVGVFRRGTLRSRDGYLSLKRWEAKTGARCRLVVSVGPYAAIARFAGYSRYKGEGWIVSAVSSSGADDLKSALRQYGITDRVVMTQVVPMDSNLPIVQEAREALGDRFGYVSLEGYLVGRMFVSILRSIDGRLSRENFLKAARGQRFDLGGLTLDFSTDNQGSDLVLLTYLDGDRYELAGPDGLRRVLSHDVAVVRREP